MNYRGSLICRSAYPNRCCLSDKPETGDWLIFRDRCGSPRSGGLAVEVRSSCENGGRWIVEFEQDVPVDCTAGDVVASARGAETPVACVHAGRQYIVGDLEGDIARVRTKLPCAAPDCEDGFLGYHFSLYFCEGDVRRFKRIITAGGWRLKELP